MTSQLRDSRYWPRNISLSPSARVFDHVLEVTVLLRTAAFLIRCQRALLSLHNSQDANEVVSDSHAVNEVVSDSHTFKQVSICS